MVYTGQGTIFIILIKKAIKKGTADYTDCAETKVKSVQSPYGMPYGTWLKRDIK
jgi:hypothetical protein